MNPSTTALILVGYQNDYFGEDGLLSQVIGKSSRVNHIIANTVKLIENLPDSVLIISTLISFTPSYEELVELVGILKISILSDCTAARTTFEQEFYCKNIFPAYGNVINISQLFDNLLNTSSIDSRSDIFS